VDLLAESIAGPNGAAAQPHPAAGGGAKPRSEAQGCRLQPLLGGAARDARQRPGGRRSVERAQGPSQQSLHLASPRPRASSPETPAGRARSTTTLGERRRGLAPAAMVAHDPPQTVHLPSAAAVRWSALVRPPHSDFA
jgi:hypothetical protein